MSKYRVLVTRRLTASALNILKTRCDVDLWDSDDVIPRDELLRRVRGKDGVLCLLTDRVDKTLLDAAGDQLRVISTLSVGVDHIDINECKMRAIKLGHTPDILTSATAELAVGLLLATTRRIVEGASAVRNGTWGSWKIMWMCGPTLDGSTVGFYGLGRIGVAILERLRPFGVDRFVYHTPQQKGAEFDHRLGATWVSFDELLLMSDFVVTCCALNEQTSGIFDSKRFKQMKNSSVFLNISRGAVINQDDLLHALRAGEILAAGIDVTTPEPLPPDHPLLSLDNCVVTPHIGSATSTTRSKMAELAANNLMQGLERDPMPAPFLN